MSAFLEGIGAVIGKVCQYIPGQVEKWRNEQKDLEDEKRKLSILNLDINKPEDRKKAFRLDWVLNRLEFLDGRLRNKAKD